MADPPPPPPADPRAARLAAALRANLRRRKAPAVDASAASAREGDGVDGGERLYPPGRDGSGGG